MRDTFYSTVIVVTAIIVTLLMGRFSLNHPDVAFGSIEYIGLLVSIGIVVFCIWPGLHRSLNEARERKIFQSALIHLKATLRLLILTLQKLIPFIRRKFSKIQRGTK